MTALRRRIAAFKRRPSSHVACVAYAGPAPSAPGGAWPPITCVLPTANEAHSIKDRVAALCASYPPEKLDIVVVINNSTDATGTLCASMPVRVLHSPPGKLHALERGRQAARTEIVVATDCDVRHEADAIRRLVRTLADAGAEVCAVSASTAFQVAGATRLARHACLYQRRYSRACHDQGERVSALMVQGPLTAYRASTMPPYAAGRSTEDELSQGIAVLRAGRRAVVHPEVWAIQPAPEEPAALLRLRTRHAARQVHTCLRNLDLPWRSDVDAVGRRLFAAAILIPRCAPWLAAAACVALTALGTPWAPLALALPALAALTWLRPYMALQALALAAGWGLVLTGQVRGCAWRNAERGGLPAEAESQ